jgi:hypothetical protein
VEKEIKRGDKFYILGNRSAKNQAGELINRGGWVKMDQICQNELTNHTLVTALVRTVFVRELRARLDASS